MVTAHEDSIRAIYAAYVAYDKKAAGAMLTDGFTFSSPADPHLDREQYFEKCWPVENTIRRFRFLRILTGQDDAFVTYEAERVDGSKSRTRNTSFSRAQRSGTSTSTLVRSRASLGRSS